MKRTCLPIFALIAYLAAAPWAAGQEASSPERNPVPAQEKSETDPLVDEYFERIEAGQYDEAGKVVDQMEIEEPDSPLVPMLRNWVDRFKAEPDEEKRAGLYFEFLGDTFKLLGEAFQGIGESMGELDAALETLGPKDSEEALAFAAIEGKTEQVETLLDQGVSPNAKESFGQTALELAISQGHFEIAQLLVDRGADVNLPSMLGMTPLISAAARGDIPGVKLLLASGADVNLKDQVGGTALSRARKYQHTQVIQLLEQAGAHE